MNRRTFLKIAGMGSVSLAAGCGSKPEKNLYALVEAPEDMVTGTATWYASTCRECPAGCGVLAKNREGRVIKLEGNPAHPINAGRLCMRGHAALQGVYNPDRITTPLLREKDRWMPLGFAEAESLLREKATAAAAKGPDRVRMVSEVTGDALLSLFSRSLARWHSKPPLVFEPLAYESLKTANQHTFGVAGLPGLRMEQADVLVSFGADFLDTWLSPVEYARKFKSMHTLQAGDRKGRFFFIGPYQSVTGANADRWLPCIPGGEAAVALGLLRRIAGRRPGPSAARQYQSGRRPSSGTLRSQNRSGTLRHPGRTARCPTGPPAHGAKTVDPGNRVRCKRPERPADQCGRESAQPRARPRI